MGLINGGHVRGAQNFFSESERVTLYLTLTLINLPYKKVHFNLSREFTCESIGLPVVLPEFTCEFISLLIPVVLTREFTCQSAVLINPHFNRNIMESLLKTATSRCPFLKNTPASQLRHLSTIKSNGSSALLRQAYRCPVLSKALHTTDPHQTSATSTLNATTTTTPSASLFEFHERPVFDYDAFFAGELEKKHSDQSYRYFNNINRLAKEYPLAHTRDPKEKVTVWCSNDYLGMSKHEGVIDAMK